MYLGIRGAAGELLVAGVVHTASQYLSTKFSKYTVITHCAKGVYTSLLCMAGAGYEGDMK